MRCVFNRFVLLFSWSIILNGFRLSNVINIYQYEKQKTKLLLNGLIKKNSKEKIRFKVARIKEISFIPEF